LLLSLLLLPPPILTCLYTVQQAKVYCQNFNQCFIQSTVNCQLFISLTFHNGNGIQQQFHCVKRNM
jgi:hypothetical protein